MIATPYIHTYCVYMYSASERIRVYESFNTSPGDIPVPDTTMVAVEVALGVGVSWIFLLSAVHEVRSVKTHHIHLLYWVTAFAWAICCIAPMITSCMVDLSDPVEALAAIGGGYVIVWLVMLAFANFSSVMVNPYFLSCNLQSMFLN